MLRILVQLVPGGDEDLVREVARAELANISDLARISDYAIIATEGVNRLAALPAWSKRGLITKHDRRQSVWKLVERAAEWAARQAEEDS
ncbi:MAG: hypothetical protein JWR80_7856 [Bradyrhizobium sp.]|nr:hypothetical protein [Bradyrhizobium sp.]